MTEKDKNSNTAGIIGSVVAGFFVGNLFAGKKRVAGSHSKDTSRYPKIFSKTKQKYQMKRDELYLAGLKRDEKISRDKNRLQSEARQKAIKESTLYKNEHTG
ncbi:hypothetical protein [Thalassobacillus sp. B23F22_16]|uniref:hypothetical protein n=1 Tax=Thalassobacillus sp. B23F22_16 TaxID=3459513 RepID=UPI00373E0F3B